MQQAMSDAHVMHAETVRVVLLGQSIPVEVRVMSSYKTLLSFMFLHAPYTFDIVNWRSGGQAPFYNKFHEVARDPETFGSRDDTGAVVANLQQKINMVMQAVRDLFVCLDQILVEHQRHVLDYAVWYREKAARNDTYGHFITRITCHCIAHTDFMVGSVNYALVEFSPAPAPAGAATARI